MNQIYCNQFHAYMEVMDTDGTIEVRIAGSLYELQFRVWRYDPFPFSGPWEWKLV